MLTLRTTSFLPLMFVTLALAASPAKAQRYYDNDVLMQRIEQIEKNMNTMQRQTAKGSKGGDAAAYVPPPAAGVARADARVDELEERLRQMQGKIEEVQFQNRQLGEQLQKLNGDLEYRLNELEHKQVSAAPTTSAPAATTPEPEPVASSLPSETTTMAVKEEKKDAAGTQSFTSARDHYNYAFKLLNQTKYEESARYFTSFLKQYPKDALAGNAYYWLGETYYVRRDYVKAADNFRQGFEVLPNGPKAGDNLLKLAMSLSATKQQKDACVVLKQVLIKFGDDSSTMRQKAQQEQERGGCN